MSQKGIMEFENLRDPQILNNIYINTDNEVFVKYGFGKAVSSETSSPKNREREKVIAKLEKNIAALRDVI